ncbi:hypothetical protein WJX73_008317 [Symbiochloris irregularis]|uniref:Isochorismatase-like domain-containing protein n=1 Tax=Symbiochloris irregularis TaxID=706552 RepID=A0AAW1P024_9CHLO
MAEIVSAKPYKWPCCGELRADNTALIIIDMQVDFCCEGGYVHTMGYDVSGTCKPIEPIKKMLKLCRSVGIKVIHTREGHRPELSDLPANKQWRSAQIGAPIGGKGPNGRILTRGSPGWEIIPELAPIDGEIIIDKPGKGCFYATDLQLVLHTCGIRNIVLAGVTTDVCVHTTMRDANDRGYECLLLSDCTAATDPANHAAACNMVLMQGGVFGAVATSSDFISAASAQLHVPMLANGHAKPSSAVATVIAKPYDYPLPLDKTAVVMVDFQKDFMLKGGFGDALGNDLAQLQECVPGAQALLKAARAAHLPIVHTLEAHKPDLSDLHPCKLTRGNPKEGMRIGDKGAMGRILIRDEPGNGIVDELAPLPGEKLLHKPGKGAFYNTELEAWLQAHGITHLLFAGVTTEVCVQTSMREANDRGYECLLVSDATGSYFPEFKAAAIAMIVAQGGIVGWAADSAAVAAAIEAASK